MNCCGKAGVKSRIVYACAGCADVGGISDLVSRKLRQDGFAQPTASCLAGIGAGIQMFIDVAKSAEEVVAIDGCGVACAQKILENNMIESKSYILTEMGCEKGKMTISEEIVNGICDRIIKREIE